MAKTKRPRMNPREPLTAKAKYAIHLYVSLRLKGRRGLAFRAIDYVLKAERMRRADLYLYLSERGYRWDRGIWRQRKRAFKPKVAKPAQRPAKPTPRPRQSNPIPMTEDEIREFVLANVGNISPRKH